MNGGQCHRSLKINKEEYFIREFSIAMAETKDTLQIFTSTRLWLT